MNNLKPLKQELEDRWLLFQFSSEELFEKFDKWEWNFYCGFDPTADSLHLWNFIWFMVAVHLMRRWNKYTALTGWATWMIWDPWGKDAERTFLSIEDLDKNEKKISAQIKNISENLENFSWTKFNFDFVNNKDFYEWMWYLDFLREVWKYITVNNMIAKDTVKKRIEDENKSISYTEFSYMLLQWYDFVKLFKDKNVTLQIWGQDQWWNLVTWTEIIRKKYDAKTNVLTWPLITDSTWRKFWKSEWNAIWLDKSKTSPYFIYQYFMNTSDDDISRYLKMLTLIEVDEIDEIVKNHFEAPEKREGQKILAFKVVEILHWATEADLAEKISDFMFWNEDKMEILKNLNASEIETFQNAIWGFKYWENWELENLFEVLVKSLLENSNSNARKSIQWNAISINWEKIKCENNNFDYDFEKNFIQNVDWNLFILIQKWKKNFRIITK